MMQTAGRLQYFTQAWSTITSDNFVLSAISGYKIPFINIPIQSAEPQQSQSENGSMMQVAIEHLLGIGAIRKCFDTEGQFLSNVFLVPKSNGKMRLILNLKRLNEFVHTEHFKMENFKTALKLVSKGCYMAKLDLQDAYFAIPIHKDHRKFLRFRCNGQLFEYVCMPFGLNAAPWVFTKVVKPIVGYLRGLGWTSVVYLDDWLFIADSQERCRENLAVSRDLLESLGFIVNVAKSNLIPSVTCQFLGFIFDSASMTLELTEKKRKNILDLVTKFKEIRSCSIREFAQFVGNIAAACPAVNYGWFHSKSLEREKYLALLESKDNYDANMRIAPCLQKDLSWWHEKISYVKNPIRQSNYALTIFSDASLSGWGASCNGEVACGQWSGRERSLHINCLEIIAAFNGLKSFATELTGCEILLKIDNSTAIAYINKMGGTKYRHLNDLACEIWSWCEPRQIWLFATYIPSRENTDADMASRVENVDTEWELAPRAFSEISERFGNLEVDLFASRFNSKCRFFCSWHKDPEALCIDAFTLDWEPLNFYAFPPFSLILKTLRKIQVDQACGIVVVPDWRAQPWYPLWLSLLQSPPIFFQPSLDLLSDPYRRTQHPLAGKLSLMAGKLSGMPIRGAESRTT